MQVKKYVVLIVLFILPIVAYLFFASGVNNFGKLPILTNGVNDVTDMEGNATFKNKITVVGLLGNNPDKKNGNAFNLNQKIYKRFYQFKDFQFVMVMPKGTEVQATELKKELGHLVDMQKWNFVFGDEKQVKDFFSSLKTDIQLENDLSTPYAFIIDKELNLRGRTKDGVEATLYGFDATSVSELNNKMVDDVKIILAEYRLALKKNNADRQE
ncbi:hypothetical protein [Zobellia uliginosa]|uniref:hypothetical protein n=1 Tax=Zobellia uliginosa TaxID=143224 RepID=UPI001C078291|nr:hypothetical protein [Zobellia uliginosa]MBU2947641.1 hypothetical protein [Zobellia uliginosa]